MGGFDASCGFACFVCFFFWGGDFVDFLFFNKTWLSVSIAIRLGRQPLKLFAVALIGVAHLSADRVAPLPIAAALLGPDWIDWISCLAVFLFLFFFFFLYWFIRCRVRFGLLPSAVRRVLSSSSSSSSSSFFVSISSIFFGWSSCWPFYFNFSFDNVDVPLPTGSARPAIFGHHDRFLFLFFLFCFVLFSFRSPTSPIENERTTEREREREREKREKFKLDTDNHAFYSVPMYGDGRWMEGASPETDYGPLESHSNEAERKMRKKNKQTNKPNETNSETLGVSGGKRKWATTGSFRATNYGDGRRNIGRIPPKKKEIKETQRDFQVDEQWMTSISYTRAKKKRNNSRMFYENRMAIQFKGTSQDDDLHRCQRGKKMFRF